MLRPVGFCGATEALPKHLRVFVFFLYFLFSAPFRSISFDSKEQRSFERCGHSGMHFAKCDKDLSFMYES